MTKYLLDTNVISAVRRADRAPSVAAWLQKQPQWWPGTRAALRERRMWEAKRAGFWIVQLFVRVSLRVALEVAADMAGAAIASQPGSWTR